VAKRTPHALNHIATVPQHAQPSSQLLLHQPTESSLCPSLAARGCGTHTRSRRTLTYPDALPPTPTAVVRLRRDAMGRARRLLAAAWVLLLCAPARTAAGATDPPASARKGGRKGGGGGALDGARSRLGRLFSSNAAATPPRTSPPFPCPTTPFNSASLPPRAHTAPTTPCRTNWSPRRAQL